MWTMLVVRDLIKKPMRFKELLESLGGVSSRTLTLKLKRLEEFEIITKGELRYSITASGKKLLPIISEMEKYGKKYL